MKKFFSGFLCAALIFSLTVSALAITGRMTIEVDPINIQVNGETFVPKDVNGAEVPVFAYNGTTYAPLRALAEAYGLEVGYDAGSNMATVADPDASVAPTEDTKAIFGEGWSTEDESAYQEFKAMWEQFRYDSDTINGLNNFFRFKTDRSRIEDYATKTEKTNAYKYLKRFLQETYDTHQYNEISVLFYDNDDNMLVWIKQAAGASLLSVDVIWDNREFKPGWSVERMPDIEL